jgi:WhiB family transcriptional regulator, redox-sensing transcriptional regulator
MDTNMWFPGRGESYKEALAICKTCPVSKQCLEWRMDTCSAGTAADDGIWGGLTANDRHRLRGYNR